MVSIDIHTDTKNFIKMFNQNTDILPVNEKRVLVSGMGGSGISGYIASVLFNQEEKKHIIPWSNYSLPKWIKKSDCVICISYSGNTAETLSAAEKASKIVC